MYICINICTFVNSTILWKILNCGFPSKCTHVVWVSCLYIWTYAIKTKKIRILTYVSSSNRWYHSIIVTLRCEYDIGLYALIPLLWDYFIFSKIEGRYQFIAFVGETEYKIFGLETFWTVTRHWWEAERI